MGAKRLFVDGYNALHKLPEFGLRRRNRDAAVARSQLADALRAIHDMEAVEVSVVYDSTGGKVTVEYPYRETTFRHLFAPAGVTADGLIEQMVSRAADPARITVVSADRLLGEAVTACGALVLSPEALRDWIRSASERMRSIY